MKKRPPISQLRKAGRMARELLAQRGIEAKDSILSKIERTKGSPTLPGIPSYLPHKWTIEASRFMMYGLLKQWVEKNKDIPEKVEDAAEFFKFVIHNTRVIEKKYKKKHTEMSKLIKKMDDVPVLKDLFGPLRIKQTAHAINKFFIDSFAVSVMVKNHETIGVYADWFLNEWTPALHKLWIKKDNENINKK